MPDEPAKRVTLPDLPKDSPNYWTEACKGTPASVVLPPYIRFLQGLLLLRKALVFLRRAKEVARAGQPELLAVLGELEYSKDSKQLGVNYETFFASHLTISLVSEVEHFFGNAVSAALRMHPEKMGDQSFKLAEIVAASSTDELIDRAARAVLNSLMYEKPLDYLRKLASILSIEERALETQWPMFVELKARRDIGVHNNWVVNEIYLRKLKESKISTPCASGERAIPGFDYLLQAMESCQQLVDTMAALLVDKWLKIPKKEERSNNAIQPTCGDARG